MDKRTHARILGYKIRIALGAVLSLGLAALAQAQVFYVDPNGDDNNIGTIDQPWRTVQKAASTLAAGQTAMVRGGVYNESVTVTVSGSQADGFVTLRNFEGETPILDGRGLPVADDGGGLFFIEDQNYIAIKGFELRNLRSSTPDLVPIGILVRGAAHEIEICNNTIHSIGTDVPIAVDEEGADAHGIALFGTKAPESIRDILIEGNQLFDLNLGSSEALVLNGNVEAFTILGNTIYQCDNIAIDLIGFEGTAPDPAFDQARDGVVSGNTIFDISSFGNPYYGPDYSAGGIYVDGGRDIVIEGNRVYRADIGIEIVSEHQGRATSAVTVRNNFVYENFVTGIALGGSSPANGSTVECTIVNNTLYRNDSLKDGSGEILFQFDTRDNIVKNNIIYANEQSLFIGSPFQENSGNELDYNLYFSPATAAGEWEWQQTLYASFDAYRSATGNDAHSQVVDPGLAEPESFELHLADTSPAIDAGVILPEVGAMDIDGQTRVQGAGLDIGADEVGPRLAGDFDQDREVGFADFFLFADRFGLQSDQPGYELVYDLDGDGIIGFEDFFIFADFFGRQADEAPPEPNPEPSPEEALLVFAAIGDYGDEDDDTQQVVAMIKRWSPDFVVTVGDNDYSDGAFRGSFTGLELGVGQYFHDYIGAYKGTSGPGAQTNRFFPTPGDHDWGDTCDDPAGLDDYLAYFTLPEANSGNERYYDFRQGPVHFFALDSVEGCEPDGTSPTSVQGQWVQGAAQASDAPFKVAYFHHSPYSSGTLSRDGDGHHMRWPWDDWGFDLVLSGHDHVYDRIVRNELTYLVIGLGGNGRHLLERLAQDSLVRFNDAHGALRVEVYQDRLECVFVTVEGQEVDRFAIQRSQ